ncbi:hypothetical protein HN51_057931 [Arachis hypogaea]|uniref:transcription factor bHLH30-like n=1 Tax=Arachis hypogaea TaxID=3818 RepID=UPI0007AFA811|nr:transcription factor bHLH30-like [Arachis hypogaea]QHN81063.1 Transcription factor [Arachis hypogaea]
MLNHEHAWTETQQIDVWTKLTLLGEVVKQVKELKKNAEEASKGFLIPMDSNEVKVEATEEGDGSSMSYRATVCCEYPPDLLSDLRQTFDGLQLQLVSAQVSTLGDRVKNEVVYTCYCKGDMMSSVEACQVLARNLHQSLSSLLTSHPIHNRRLRCLQTSAVSCYN